MCHKRGNLEDFEILYGTNTGGDATMPKPTDSKVAIRLPNGVGKTPTQILVHEGIRQSLERRLSQAQGGPVVLSITDNRGSVVVKTPQKGVLYARVHFMFLDAPPDVMADLVNYLTSDDERHGHLLDEYIAANMDKLARKRAPAISTAGKVHDLEKIFNEVNQKYFGGACSAKITWGKKGIYQKGKPRKTIRLGSYGHVDRLITIHPTLDRKWVPRYFIACVVYHEMLHNMIPSARGTYSAKNMQSPRVLHPPEFLEREKLFKSYNRAIEWERKNIARILRTP